MDQYKDHKINFNSETKLIPVTDLHYLLSIHDFNIEHSFNIKHDTLPLDQLDNSLLYPVINNLYRKD